MSGLHLKQGCFSHQSPARALLRNSIRGHFQTQREICDRPTSLPTISVFSCHLPSHASPAKHWTCSPGISPLSVLLTPPTPSHQVRLDALWLSDPYLVVQFGRKGSEVPDDLTPEEQQELENIRRRKQELLEDIQIIFGACLGEELLVEASCSDQTCHSVTSSVSNGYSGVTDRNVLLCRVGLQTSRWPLTFPWP
ncbi:hypothetical protein F7725_003381 [Dissostichus mawsoni]|uniref:Uncharacterized protein n=1 Tax=Dissostichus mawsoni TaxID=36200 RepID=A0A7J5YB08_DISMA|nr:hypothetical protein F7725_003381 [Dissostichus mawsoni]